MYWKEGAGDQIFCILARGGDLVPDREGAAVGILVARQLGKLFSLTSSIETLMLALAVAFQKGFFGKATKVTQGLIGYFHKPNMNWNCYSNVAVQVKVLAKGTPWIGFFQLFIGRNSLFPAFPILQEPILTLQKAVLGTDIFMGTNGQMDWRGL